MAEIDAARLDALQKAERLFNSLLDDPKTGMDLKRAIKDKYPQARVHDLEIIEQVTKPYDDKLAAVEAKNTALENALNELKQARETDTAEAKLAKELAGVRAKHNLTDEGMTKVIEAMRDRGLAHDPEAAAALIVSQMPKAAPSSVRSSLISPDIDIYGMQSPKLDEKWEKLHTQPWKYLQDECIAVMDEFAQAEHV